MSGVIDLGGLERRAEEAEATLGAWIGVRPEEVAALVRAARWLTEAYEAEPPVLSPITRDKTAEVVAPFRGPPVGA